MSRQHISVGATGSTAFAGSLPYMTAAPNAPTPPAPTPPARIRTAPVGPLLSSLLREHVMPDRRMGVREWADAHFLVNRGPEQGPWRTARTPYLAEPMADFTDPDVRKVTLCMGTQLGKTNLLMIYAGYTIDQRPIDTMWLMDSKDTAGAFSKDRMGKVIDQAPRLARHKLPGRADTTVHRVEFDNGMVLYFVGANSPGQLASKPIGLVLADEIDKYPIEMKGKGGTEGSALSLAERRGDAFGREFRMVQSSTPTDEGVGVWAELARSDRAEYYTPCPHCGGFQVLRFSGGGGGGSKGEGGGLRFTMPDGSRVSREAVGSLSEAEMVALVDHVKRASWYECGHCAGRIENRHKAAMLAAGRWVRRGEQMTRDGRVTGTRVRSDHRGYRLSSLCSPWLRFGDVAAKFIEDRCEMTREFVGSFLAEAWVAPGQRVDADEFIAMTRDQPAEVCGVARPRYRRGRVPDYTPLVSRSLPAPPPGLLLGTVDVQPDVAYWEVRAWAGGRAMHNWLIDWGVVECPTPHAGVVLEHDAWADVGRRLWELYPVEGDESHAMPVAFWGVDSGHRTGEVYRLAELMGGYVVPMKGSGQQREMVAASQSPDPEKHGLSRAVELVLFGTDAVKDAWSAARAIKPPMEGASHWPEGGVDAEYARHQSAEERRRMKDRRGNYHYEWHKRGEHRRNDWFDCSCMNYALALYLGISSVERVTPAMAAGAGAKIRPPRGEWRPVTPEQRAGRGGLRAVR